jgi:dTDP-4-dehydrorhamnose reductase
MAKILVTGSNGQLGSELQKLSDNTSGNFIFTDIDTLDITDYPSLEKFCLSHNFKIIINCAAYTAVDKAESDTDKAYAINCTAVKNLTQVARLLDATLIQISTDYVFDGAANTPYSETDAINPISVYGKTKAAGEKEALLYDKSVIIRTAWLYSTFGNNIVKTILKLSKERNSLGFVFDQTGTPTYAEDLAKAILTIVDDTFKEGTKAGIYHFSNEGVCSWYDVAYEIIHYTNNKNCSIKPIETHEYPTPAKRPAYSVLNKQKIRNTFGIKIPHWRDSLQKCLNNLTNNI